MTPCDNKQKAKNLKPNQIQSDVTLGFSENHWSANIPLITPKEVADEIRTNLNSKKAPGFDLITGEVLKQLPKKGIVMLTYIFNAALRLRYFPTI